MSHQSTCKVLAVYGLLAVCFGTASCGVDAEVEVLHQAQSLEEACADAPSDVTADVLAIVSSTEPLDPTEPQAYGSAACGGFIFEFDNPDDEPLHGAWVQAGPLQLETDALGASRCPARELRADYWGFKDKEWMKLAAAESFAAVGEDEEEAHCALDALIEQEGTFEKLRIVARATQDAQTYPMIACLW